MGDVLERLFGSNKVSELLLRRSIMCEPPYTFSFHAYTFLYYVHKHARIAKGKLEAPLFYTFFKCIAL